MPIQKEAKLTADSPSVKLTSIVPIPIDISVNKPMMIIIWLLFYEVTFFTKVTVVPLIDVS